MQLLIRQRVFSWTDSYDVYDPEGQPRYTVRAEFLALGHQIHVYDKRTGQEVGSIHQRLLTLLPQFEIVTGGQVRGTVRKAFSLFTPPVYRGFSGLERGGGLSGLGLPGAPGRRNGDDHFQGAASLERYLYPDL